MISISCLFTGFSFFSKIACGEASYNKCLVSYIWDLVWGVYYFYFYYLTKFLFFFACSLRDMVPIIITCWHILPFEVRQCFSEAIRYKAEHG